MKKGFTLIELLIVVSIIGILAVALIPSISDAPRRARDAARKAMVNNVVAAVESYNLDEDTYPGNSGCLVSTTTDVDLLTLEGYMGGSGFPRSGEAVQDPLDDDTDCTVADDGTYVLYYNDGTAYHVGIRLEQDGKGTHTYDAATGFTAAVGGNYFAVVR